LGAFEGENLRNSFSEVIANDMDETKLAKKLSNRALGYQVNISDF